MDYLRGSLTDLPFWLFYPFHVVVFGAIKALFLMESLKAKQQYETFHWNESTFVWQLAGAVCYFVSPRKKNDSLLVLYSPASFNSCQDFIPCLSRFLCSTPTRWTALKLLHSLIFHFKSFCGPNLRFTFIPRRFFVLRFYSVQSIPSRKGNLNSHITVQG